jgi:hypothetical protein
MEIKVNEDGQTVITSTNPDEIVGYLKSRDTRKIETFRPVHIFTIDDPVRNDGLQRPGVEFGSSLVKSIGITGFHADDASYDDLSSDLYQFTFERNLPWKSIPVVSEPSAEHSAYSVRQLDHNGNYAAEQKRIVGKHVGEEVPYQQLLQENVKVLVIASHELIDAYITKALGAWSDVQDERLPVVIHHGPDGGSIVPLERIRSARDRFKAEARFLYNHALNFSVLARRALFKIYFDEQLSKQVARHALPSVSEYRWRWAHPFFLQILHHLKRLGRIGTDEHRIQLNKKVDGFSYAHVYAKGLPVFEKTGDRHEFVWKGTGAYPESRIAVGRAPEPGEQDPNAYSSHFEHPYFQVFHHIEHTGLLGLDGDDIVLSPWGVKFLEIMGPDTDDADVLLRWRTPTGEIGGAESVKAMDRWLNRVFRSVKRRVAQFPDQLALFDDETYFKAPVSNQLSLLGVHLALNDADFDDPHFAAEVARIGDSEATIPIAARNYGLVHEPAKMGAESKVTGIWVGVPLAVAYSDPLTREPGWLQDLRKERTEAGEAMRAATPLLRKRLEGSDIKPIHGLPIVESTGLLRELPWALDADDGDILRPIFLGVTSTVDKTAPASKALTTRLMINSSSDSEKGPAPKYYDGISHWHGKGTNLTTATCGYFIGLYNETRDTFLVDREIHPNRIERFENNREFMLGNMGPYFEVDRSEQGYWTVLSDGTTKKINLSLQS